MEKIHENMCKQECSYVFIQENYIKARSHVFSPISAHFDPPPPPHYIIMVKGLLGVAFGLAGSAYIDMHGHVCKLN